MRSRLIKVINKFGPKQVRSPKDRNPAETRYVTILLDNLLKANKTLTGDECIHAADVSFVA